MDRSGLQTRAPVIVTKLPGGVGESLKMRLEADLMAHIWLQDENREWTAHPLADAEFRLKTLINEARGHSPAMDQIPPDAQLLKTKADNNGENWVVVAGCESGVSINGIPLFLGIRTLRDRDEIRWSPDDVVVFSTEELAAVVNFPGSDRKITCPRCKQDIEPGTPVVLCPRCKLYYHQSEQFNCYTYSESCATCDRKSSIDNEFEWTPEAM